MILLAAVMIPAGAAAATDSSGAHTSRILSLKQEPADATSTADADVKISLLSSTGVETSSTTDPKLLSMYLGVDPLMLDAGAALVPAPKATAQDATGAATRTLLVASSCCAQDRLETGWCQPSDGCRKSNNGKYSICMQSDGNAVVYGPSSPLWSSDTWKYGKGYQPYKLCMQDDGNLVVYTKDQKPIWASNTYGQGNSKMIMQDDGNLVVYRLSDGKATWASNTMQSGSSNNNNNNNNNNNQGSTVSKCSDISTVLSYSTQVRAKHQAGGLAWSETLAKSAQAYADYLASSNRCGLVHSGQKGVGENLAMNMDSRGVDKQCNPSQQAWYNEVSRYNFNTQYPWTTNQPTFHEWGHFTQMVWVSTTSIGCGVSLGRYNDGNPCKVVVCHYSPPGNIVDDGYFRDNVRRAQ